MFVMQAVLPVNRMDPPPWRTLLVLFCCWNSVLSESCQDVVDRLTNHEAVPYDAFVPQCKPDGSYVETQCYNAFSPRCWCVDEDGNEIDGTSREDGILPTCGAPPQAETCQQVVDRISNQNPQPLDIFIPQCKPDGSYVETQCYNAFQPRCWCVDDNGNEIDGTSKQDGSLPDCDDDLGDAETCQEIVDRLTNEEAAPDDVFLPICKPDGSYEETQCFNGPTPRCWCVDEDGNEIDGTSTENGAIPSCNSSGPEPHPNPPESGQRRRRSGGAGRRRRRSGRKGWGWGRRRSKNARRRSRSSTRLLNRLTRKAQKLLIPRRKIRRGRGARRRSGRGQRGSRRHDTVA